MGWFKSYHQNSSIKITFIIHLKWKNLGTCHIIFGSSMLSVSVCISMQFILYILVFHLPFWSFGWFTATLKCQPTSIFVWNIQVYGWSWHGILPNLQVLFNLPFWAYFLVYLIGSQWDYFETFKLYLRIPLPTLV